MTELDSFRKSARAWLADNCPPGARGSGEVPNGSTKIEIQDSDTKLWLDRMIQRGWTVPAWPKEYGGADLSPMEQFILNETSAVRGAPRVGVPDVGSTIMVHGNDDQKKEFLPPMV